MSMSMQPEPGSKREVTNLASLRLIWRQDLPRLCFGEELMDANVFRLLIDGSLYFSRECGESLRPFQDKLRPITGEESRSEPENSSNSLLLLVKTELSSSFVKL